MKKKYRLKKSVKIVFALILCGVIGAFAFSNSNKKEVNIIVGDTLEVVSVGSYSGKYMEDGSDEKVNNVMMIEVVNRGEQVLQYGQIVVGEYVFDITTLPVGEKCMVLEKNRLSYDKKVDFHEASLNYDIYFKDGLKKYGNLLVIQGLEGAMNIANVSGSDIKDVIYVYYKNKSDDSYLGGITYRVKVDGIQKGMMAQVMSSHFSSNSEIMFVTIGNE